MTERTCEGCGIDISDRRKGTLYCEAECGRIAKLYGIGLLQYNQLFAMQGGRCAICKNVSRAKRMAIDHSHVTGAVRGLLCQKCNFEFLTAGKHNPALFEAAATYLRNPPFARLLKS